ncbi:uncharacterized protein PSFLO_02551 [Pseudozyma flocculosa]|uniref:Secreted protein n=1 Tax=Pseudozyma flocculosa TaxID=84751 RepID=A0A5C3F0V0_9BASI|nr:uncharacterized protein PSFLO_02551 [Pseudozyma flocculosa]
MRLSGCWGLVSVGCWMGLPCCVSVRMCVRCVVCVDGCAMGGCVDVGGGGWRKKDIETRMYPRWLQRRRGWRASGCVRVCVAGASHFGAVVANGGPGQARPGRSSPAPTESSPAQGAAAVCPPARPPACLPACLPAVAALCGAAGAAAGVPTLSLMGGRRGAEEPAQLSLCAGAGWAIFDGPLSAGRRGKRLRFRIELEQLRPIWRPL